MYTTGIDMKSHIESRINQANEVVQGLQSHADDITEISRAIIHCFEQGGTLFVAGNGGSAAQANHLCEELTGRYRETRPALPAHCLCSDAVAMTCIANDFGWEQVFRRQLEAFATCIIDEHEEQSCNDLLLVLTTSGNSENINEALDFANDLGMMTLGLLGRDGGESKSKCTLNVTLDANDSAAIQDGHHVIIHAICGAIEQWVLESIEND